MNHQPDPATEAVLKAATGAMQEDLTRALRAYCTAVEKADMPRAQAYFVSAAIEFVAAGLLANEVNTSAVPTWKLERDAKKFGKMLHDRMVQVRDFALDLLRRGGR